MITAESNGTTVTIRITCNACDGGEFQIATAHMQTLARVLPKICAQVGINLDEGGMDAHVFNLGSAENVKAAERLYAEFVQREDKKEGKDKDQTDENDGGDQTH